MTYIYQKYKANFHENMILALPIMAGQLGQVFVNLADNLMVGTLGADALAAVAIANSIFIAFMVVGMGISFALPPLVSQADGAKKYARIPKYFKHSLLVNLSFAIVSILLITFLGSTINSLGQDPDIIVLAMPYLEVSIWSLVPMMAFLTLRAYTDGMSKTSYAMKAMIIGNVANIVLNYGLINGKLGMPNYGVVGASMASFVARVLMMVAMIIFLIRDVRLSGYLKKINFKKYQKHIFQKILSLGLPSSMQAFFEVSAFSGAALIMGLIGKNEQAAHQIAISMASITFLIATGLAMASTIRVGKEFGKMEMVSVRNVGYSVLIQVTGFMFITAILFIILRTILPHAYIDDPIVIGIASYLLLFAAIFQIPDGIQVVGLGVLRGIQDVKIPTLITFASYWLFGIPISYYSSIHFGFGAGGVWLGLIMGLSLSAVLLVIRFNYLTKKTITVIND